MKQSKKKIVVLGGGTGLSVILRGLKRYDVDITAIVTVADDGGSTGRIREELGIPAPGDIRNVLVSLSNVEPLLEQLFQHRFDNNAVGHLAGHSLGNLLIAAMSEITGDFTTGVHEMGKVLNVNGRVLPSTNHNVTLHAEMTDGTVISGESKIPKAGKKVRRVYLTPDNIHPLPRAKRALMAADLIVIGPGSLYTSIIPNLIVPTLSEVISSAKAQKVYICNIMTQHGETSNYTASDHIQAIFNHTEEQWIDTILVNKEELPVAIRQKYKDEKAKPVKVDIEALEKMNLTVIQDAIVAIEGETVRHDAHCISQILYDLIKK